jgi:hypothetical protein
MKTHVVVITVVEKNEKQPEETAAWHEQEQLDLGNATPQHQQQQQ